MAVKMHLFNRIVASASRLRLCSLYLAKCLPGLALPSTYNDNPQQLDKSVPFVTGAGFVLSLTSRTDRLKYSGNRVQLKYLLENPGSAVRMQTS